MGYYLLGEDYVEQKSKLVKIDSDLERIESFDLYIIG